MKQKFMFGLQVFSTLILFMAIFVTYLERGDVILNDQKEKREIINSETGSNETLVRWISNSFTTSFSGVISWDK